jgi:hypothetical protein
VYDNAASPCPACSPDTATQLESVDTDQVQSRAVVIVSEPFPPPAPNDDGAADAVTAHRSADGAVSEVSVLLHPKKAIADAAHTADRNQLR